MCIDDVTKEIRKSSTFTCIGCGHEMSAALGDVREHYFRHKNNENCSHETYLHNYAKRRIKEKFDTDNNFYIYYKAMNSCEQYNTCRLHRCKRLFLQQIDLKEYFDTCEIEKFCDGFIPDVLLTHSAFPKRKIFIEIHVYSPCSQKKLASGYKIIEIDIHDETSIIYPFNEEYENVHFHNFSFQRNLIPSSDLQRISFLVDKNGQVNLKKEIIDCSKKDEHLDDALFDLTIKKQHEKINLESLILSHATIKNIVRHCGFCRHFMGCIVTILDNLKDETTGEIKTVQRHVSAKQLTDEGCYYIADQCKKFSADISGCSNLIKHYGPHNFLLWENANKL